MSIDIGRIGVWINLDAVPSPELRDAASAIEAMGYGALWVPEAVGREPFVLAANILSATSSLVVATGIANIYARDPMTMAAAQATMLEAWPDRFLLGLGVSHHHLVERLRGHDYSKPYSYMAAYLEQMSGAMYQSVAPPGDRPIVLAALGPRMLGLSATAARGAHPYFAPVEHTAFAREIIGPDALLAPEQMVVLDTDAERARTAARAGMGVYLRAPNYRNNLARFGFTDDDMDGPSDRLVDAIVAWGDANTVAARVRAQHEAGADHVCVQVLASTGTVPLDELASLAEALV